MVFNNNIVVGDIRVFSNNYMPTIYEIINAFGILALVFVLILIFTLY